MPPEGVAGDRSWADLYWLPLGAGGHFVRFNGRVYERICAWRQKRLALDLYHSALQLHLDGTTFAVEMGPVWNVADPHRGTVCEGAVGYSWLGRFAAFRYEVRCWPGGYIPDLAEAVDSPCRLTSEPVEVGRLLAAIRETPALTWGRDELGAGEMWNSNSVVAWALASSGHEMSRITPPPHGRAPGWQAGLVLAANGGRAMAARPGKQLGADWAKSAGTFASSGGTSSRRGSRR